MSENYSKKQINPLCLKYGIDPQTNTLFNEIIKLFDGQTNYQVWAIKMAFRSILPLDELKKIKDWSDKNKTFIKNLSKKNIVAYSSKSDIELLHKEILGIDKICFVKNMISRFNTKQRHWLDEHIDIDKLSPCDAFSSSMLDKWFKLFTKFNNLPETRKKKFISVASAYNSFDDLVYGIENSVKESYSWYKEDMMAFIKNNVPNTEVIYDRGPIVILRIPSFTESEALCGGGRTGWCITRESSYFSNYAGETGRTQYFFFNFSKPESDELAHVGFTIENNKGIIYAHSCKNCNLKDDGIDYRGKKIYISDVLSMFNISMGLFMNIKEIKGFQWDLNSFLQYAKDNDKTIAIAYCKNNRVIVKCLTKEGFNDLVGHTFINNSIYSTNDNYSFYVMLDFNLDVKDDKSIVIIQYSKDEYGIDSFNYSFDAYGTQMYNESYLESIGISIDDYLHREQINPSILLHKYIMERREQKAIELINNDSDIDVNYEFKSFKPIFRAIDLGMLDLFQTIINNPSFDQSTEDGYGEPVLHSLVYCYGNRYINADKKTLFEKMISYIINKTDYDLNILDISQDTVLSIACSNPQLNWLVDALVDKNVNVNTVNDFNYTPLYSAIRANNIDAIKSLCRREDLVIRKEDVKLAKAKSIDLSKVGVNDEKLTFKTDVSYVSDKDGIIDDKTFNEIMERIFATMSE